MKDVSRAILGDNMFLEFNLPRGVISGLAEADHDAYRAPYPDPASRRPMLAWPREIPIDGEPADVHERVVACGRWMAASPEVPKLLLTVEGGPGSAAAETIDWARETFTALEVESVGKGGHHAPEDQPDAIGEAVARWLARHSLVTALRMVWRPAGAEDATQEINPERIVLAAHPVSASGADVEAAAAQLGTLHDAAAVFRAHPDYAAPRDRSDAILTLLRSGKFPLLK